jgi:hypothetical protein
VQASAPERARQAPPTSRVKRNRRNGRYRKLTHQACVRSAASPSRQGSQHIASEKHTKTSVGIIGACAQNQRLLVGDSVKPDPVAEGADGDRAHARSRVHMHGEHAAAVTWQPSCGAMSTAPAICSSFSHLVDDREREQAAREERPVEACAFRANSLAGCEEAASRRLRGRGRYS